eukprot:364174-Chlamydomonas_euryale.AAC.1
MPRNASSVDRASGGRESAAVEQLTAELRRRASSVELPRAANDREPAAAAVGRLTAEVWRRASSSGGRPLASGGRTVGPAEPPPAEELRRKVKFSTPAPGGRPTAAAQRATAAACRPATASRPQPQQGAAPVTACARIVSCRKAVVLA